MSNVTRENLGLLHDRLTVRVSPDDFMPGFEKSLKEYARKANIPGFRKGMVPAGMIRKMYGGPLFAEEVMRNVERTLLDYLRNEQLDIFGQPLPAEGEKAPEMDFRNPGDYDFKFEIGIKPDFRVTDLSQAKVTRYKVGIPDELVEQEVDRLRNKLGKMSEPETVASEDTVLNVTFTACDAEGNTAEDAAEKDNSLLLRYFSEPVRAKLTGLRKDDSLVIQPSAAFDEKEREWVMGDLGLDKEEEGAADRYFKMTISKLGLVTPREMDAEFFKEAFPDKEIGDEEAFRSQIREDIAHYWDAQSRNHLHHELYHVLNEQTSMEFPETFLLRWMQEGSEERKTAEEAQAEFPNFLKQLRWTLVSDRIVNEQSLQAGREEVAAQLRRQVLGYFGGMGVASGNMDWIEGYVERMMKDERQVEGAYRRVLTEKIFEWAEGRVVPEEKAISMEEFTAILEEHRHEH